jgi:hypothetical protein
MSSMKEYDINLLLWCLWKRTSIITKPFKHYLHA